MMRMPAVEDRVADRLGLVGRDAADDRDQRAVVEIAVGSRRSRSCDPLRDLRDAGEEASLAVELDALDRPASSSAAA